MDAGRGQSQHNVARGDIGAVDELTALGGSHRETRQVVIALGIHAGHFRRFAADQGASGLTAALGDTGDDARGLRHIEAAGREIVEKEKGFGPLNDQIVDAHGNEVDADGVMAAGVDRYFQFGADAIGGGDQDRVGKAGLTQIEQGAESAQPGGGAQAGGGASQRFDGFNQGFAGVDIDTRVPVGQAFGPIGIGYGFLEGLNML